MTSRGRVLASLMLTLLLSGCGFQLRGQAPELVTLEGGVSLSGLAPFGPLSGEIRQALEEAGATVVEQAAGVPTLRISDYRSTRRVLSVDRRNKVVEYELEEAFRFSLFGPDGGERVPPQQMRTLRISLNPEIQVLGRSTEEELLRSDMRRDLARQLVTRLAYQL